MPDVRSALESVTRKGDLLTNSAVSSEADTGRSRVKFDRRQTHTRRSCWRIKGQQRAVSSQTHPRPE